MNGSEACAALPRAAYRHAGQFKADMAGPNKRLVASGYDCQRPPDHRRRERGCAAEAVVDTALGRLLRAKGALEALPVCSDFPPSLDRYRIKIHA